MSDRFDHLFLAPSDFDAAVAFYRDVLGWTVTRTWTGYREERGALLSGGAIRIVIAEHGDSAQASPAPPALPRGSFRVHLDIHDVEARFLALPKGGHVVTPPEDTAWGTRWFVVRDPDGNLIAFEELRTREEPR